MRVFLWGRWIVGSVFALALMAGAGAQPAKSFTPAVGQSGKDVVWVPTSHALVNMMLDMAKAVPGDYVIDLGSGDGRTVITAAKRGIRALGIEYNPKMVELSQRAAAKEGVSDRATFRKADLFATDLSQATVITMFLLPEINLKLRPKILNLKPGTRIVSNTFTMDDWQADETGSAAASEDGSEYYRTALLWIVPAKVDGVWKSELGEFTFKQEFQNFSGAVNVGEVSMLMTGGKIRGDQISFNAGGTQYSGKVNGNTIAGNAGSGVGAKSWNVNRP